MAEAPRDNNRIPTMLALLNTDGSTLTPVKANPTQHAISYSDGTTGSDLTGDDALRDNNRVHVLIAVSNADGTTPVPLYVDSNGQLLIKST